MNRDAERVRTLLPPNADPARDLEGGGELSARAERELAALRLTAAADGERHESVRRGPGRRSVLAAAAVFTGASVLVLNGGLPWPGRDAGPQAVAATPPVLSLTPVAQSSADYLHRLADRVEKLPEEHTAGAYRYTKTWGWWLNTAGDVPGGVANAAVPTVTESWLDRQAGGRQRETFGDPIFPNRDQERDARAAGLVAGKEVSDQTYGPGKFPGGSPWKGLEPFSTDPQRLAAQLKQVSWEGGLIINGVSDMLSYEARSGPVSPELRAAALRVLADAAGLEVSTTTTWKGREVIAVSQKEEWRGSIARSSVFFDPRTGYPMGSEEALFGNARKLNVRVPATLAVVETLEQGNVASAKERP
jgi:hypothetical protein